MSSSRPSAERPTKEDIIQICALAQTALYALIGALAFLAIATLSTADADFLIGSKQTKVPVIDVSVPTDRFFFIAPLVAAVLYCHLHLYLVKLWPAVRDADEGAVESGAPRSLIGDLARYVHSGTHPRGGGHWADLGTAVSFGLCWIAHPALLLWMLARSQAADQVASADRVSAIDGTYVAPFATLPISSVSGMIVLCLALSCGVGAWSLLAALTSKWGRATSPAVAILSFLVAFVPAYFAASAFARFDTRTVILDRQNLVGLEDDWARASERRMKFRKDWCKERGVPLGICGNLALATGSDLQDRQRIETRKAEFCRSAKPRVWGCDRYFADLDDDFLAEWKQQRSAEVARLPELNLDRRSFRGASAEGAKFVNARLEQASFVGARLKDADFEGAHLLGAVLDGAHAYSATFDRANLTDARLRLASLRSARFESAALPGARLAGADLTSAHLVDTNLRGADLTGANLTNAHLERADLTDAILLGAILVGADLTAARGVTQEMLAGTVVSRGTQLPAPEDLQPRLSGITCWRGEVPDGGVIKSLAEGPLAEAGGNVLDTLDAQLCSRTEVAEAVLGPPAPAEPLATPDHRFVSRRLTVDAATEKARVEAVRAQGAALQQEKAALVFGEEAARVEYALCGYSVCYP
jgi:uncharacterized protein YjbI with pentapeptide repeats